MAPSLAIPLNLPHRLLGKVYFLFAVAILLLVQDWVVFLTVLSSRVIIFPITTLSF